MHTTSIMDSSWWPPPHPLGSSHQSFCSLPISSSCLHTSNESPSECLFFLQQQASISTAPCRRTSGQTPTAKSKVLAVGQEADGCFLSISSTLWAFKYSNEAQQWHLKRWSASPQAWIPLEELINWGVWLALFWRVFWRRQAQGERTGYRRSRLPVWDPQGQTECWLKRQGLVSLCVTLDQKGNLTTKMERYSAERFF